MLNRGFLLLTCSSLLLCLCEGSQSDEGVRLDIKQSPTIIYAQEGASVNISCVVTLPGEPDGIHITRRYRGLMHFSGKGKFTSMETNEFADRSQVSGTAGNITITLHKLRKNDTDWYTCHGAVITPSRAMPEQVVSGGTVLIVTEEQRSEKSHQPCQSMATFNWERILLVGAVFLILFLVAVIIYKESVNGCTKPHQKKSIPNTVYEDMSSSIRRNTMTRPHFNNGQNVNDNNAMGSNSLANKNMGYTSAGFLNPGMAYRTAPY